MSSRSSRRRQMNYRLADSSPCSFWIFHATFWRMSSALWDLEFADDGGLISISLFASVVASGVFFLMELPLWFTSPGRFREWSPLLSCLHLAGEDFYQFILYSVVAASQSAGGLGSSTACLPAVAELTLFIFLKFFHLVDRRVRCDSRGLDATPEVAVADPDTCGWTSTESGKG